MPNRMFANTLRLLEDLDHKTITYRMPILPDEDGYIDHECPNPNCLAQFKVKAEDWDALITDDTVYCPFCGYAAPSNQWYTTEQIEQAENNAFHKVEAMLGNALSMDARDFNASQPKKSFLKLSMNYSGVTSFVNIPAAAMEAMEQKIECDNCHAQYSVIGSAFYCPCCGKNSARLTFANTVDKVRAKIEHMDSIRETISKTSKDDAARTCESMIESSVSDLVIAFQRLCEAVYPLVDSSTNLPRNVFQRLQDGSALWKNATGKGYEDWVSSYEYDKLKICFQQRHLLQHQDGIVDQDYINKSGDNSYRIGQHLRIKDTDILLYADIVEKIGAEILAISQSHNPV